LNRKHKYSFKSPSQTIFTIEAEHGKTQQKSMAAKNINSAKTAVANKILQKIQGGPKN